MSYNLSELFERVADHVPDREAMVTTERRLTYAQLDERSTRLAHHLSSVGVGRGDHIGLDLVNGTAYIEGMLAAFKLSAVPININYRYVERELHYLFSNADLVALIFHQQFGAVVEPAAAGIDKLAHLLCVADQTGVAHLPVALDYEAAITAASPERGFGGRASDDLYCSYTGGTTGMPKGVVWTHEDIFFASMGGGDATQMEGPISTPDQLTERVLPLAASYLITAPLMHVSAHWAAFQGLFGGGKIVLPAPGSFDPVEVLELIEAESVNVVTLVGDAMARPLIDAIEAEPDRFDTTSLLALASGGAVLSPSTKARIHAVMPNVFVVDGYGSTETGVAGASAQGPDGTTDGPARFAMDATTAVLDDRFQPVSPGSGAVGHLARRGHIPLGYYKDTEKTAATFVEHGGVRWVLPGDMASVEADGTIVLHGRGSGSINTGGEKVFPEEVEAALIAMPGIADIVVTGVADERWGQRVVAIIKPRPGAHPTLDEVRAFARDHLAGYKVPRDLVVVDAITRTAAGKADYAWAKATAEAATAS